MDEDVIFVGAGLKIDHVTWSSPGGVLQEQTSEIRIRDAYFVEVEIIAKHGFGVPALGFGQRARTKNVKWGNARKEVLPVFKRVGKGWSEPWYTPDTTHQD